MPIDAPDLIPVLEIFQREAGLKAAQTKVCIQNAGNAGPRQHLHAGQ